MIANPPPKLLNPMRLDIHLPIWLHRARADETETGGIAADVQDGDAAQGEAAKESVGGTD